MFRDEQRIRTVVGMDADQLRAFDGQLMDAGLGAAGRSAYIRVIKTFTSSSRRRGLLASDVTRGSLVCLTRCPRRAQTSELNVAL